MSITRTVIMVRPAEAKFSPEYIAKNLKVKKQGVKQMWLSGNCRAPPVVSVSSKTRLTRLIQSSLQHSTVVAVLLYVLLLLYRSLSPILIPQNSAHYPTFPLDT